MKKIIILSAFNVHTGGGYVLLSALLKINKIKKFLLDNRIKKKLKLNNNKFVFIKRKILDRLFLFHKNILKKDYTHLICFNNLPPILKLNAKVILFIQTFYFFSNISNYNFNFYTFLRIHFEKIWFRIGIRNVDEIWIQTPTMKKRLIKYLKKINLKKKLIIKEVPLSDNKLLSLLNRKKKFKKIGLKKNNFFYPADGSGHKNHERLIIAFSKIKKPFKLYLTLDDKSFERLVTKKHIKNKKNFINLNNLTREKVLDIYQTKINALIFPSLDESFGIPLIEACVYNKDILVSNRRYSRDLIQNAIYFNPQNIQSIKISIDKYLSGRKFQKPKIKKGFKFLSPKEFINKL